MTEPLTPEKTEEIRAFANGTGYTGMIHATTASRLMEAGQHIRDLLSEIGRLTTEAESAREIVVYARDKVAFYEYEYLANRFFQENGQHMMAPGKSDPRGRHTDEERAAAWEKWLEEIGDIDPLESVLATAREAGRREAANVCIKWADGFDREGLDITAGAARQCARLINALTDTPKG